MRAYRTSDEEALRARDLLNDWTSEGYLTPEQYQQIELETVYDLRRTNIFLRLVLFLFTLIIVGAATALFFTVFLSPATAPTSGIFLLIFAAASYAAAELTVSRFRLYRYGIEEALAVCSVGFLCAGIQAVLSTVHSYSPWPYGTEFLVPATGIIASLWIWNRFGLHYAFLAAMIFVVWLSDCWTSLHSAQHAIVAALYAASLGTIAAVRSRHRLTFLNQQYSIVEAFLWLGIYLAVNLQLSSVDLLRQWWIGLHTTTEFPTTFYWFMWVLIWCLPPAILARGVRQKDRFVIAVGTIAAILTLATNKPYLGWPRHTWDPMLLGALLIGVALLTRRWLGAGTRGIRCGFTAQRISAKDENLMSVGSVAFGLAAPQALQPTSHPVSPDVHFGGGDSGGAGATSDF